MLVNDFFGIKRGPPPEEWPSSKPRGRNGPPCPALLEVVRGRSAGERRRTIAREKVSAREGELLVERHVDVQIVPANTRAQAEVEGRGADLVDRDRRRRSKDRVLRAIVHQRAVG